MELYLVRYTVPIYSESQYGTQVTNTIRLLRVQAKDRVHAWMAAYDHVIQYHFAIDTTLKPGDRIRSLIKKEDPLKPPYLGCDFDEEDITRYDDDFGRV